MAQGEATKVKTTYEDLSPFCKDDRSKVTMLESVSNPGEAYLNMIIRNGYKESSESIPDEFRKSRWIVRKNPEPEIFGTKTSDPEFRNPPPNPVLCVVLELVNTSLCRLLEVSPKEWSKIKKGLYIPDDIEEAKKIYSLSNEYQFYFLGGTVHDETTDVDQLRLRSSLVESTFEKRYISAVEKYGDDLVIEAIAVIQALARILPGVKIHVRGGGYDPEDDANYSTY